MQIKTILNQVQKFKSFIYGTILLIESEQHPTIEIEILPRKNSPPKCSICYQQCPGYDRLPERRFEFIPMWGFKVFFRYAPRRVSCMNHGVKVEHMPWVTGKRQMTTAYAWFLSGWAKKMSWQDVARSFRTTWHHVFNSVDMAVGWGRNHQDLSNISSIGVDEIKWQRGHSYLTLVYQIDPECKRLLWIGDKRTIKTFLKFFHWFGKERSDALKVVCSDMWRPYLKVIAKKAPAALNILDRFHIMAHMNKAIDKVRAEEVRALQEKGYEPVLKKSRWLLLKRPENLTEQQGIKLATLVRYNLKSVRSYLLKEEFQLFWLYQSPQWAGWYLDKWCAKTMRSKIEPMKKVAKMLRRHKPLLMNWFKAKGQFSSGIVEGLNTKAKLTTRKAYGFRTYRAAELSLYHTLGALPVPKVAHEFF
jgi:transposase